MTNQAQKLVAEYGLTKDQYTPNITRLLEMFAKASGMTEKYADDPATLEKAKATQEQVLAKLASELNQVASDAKAKPAKPAVKKPTKSPRKKSAAKPASKTAPKPAAKKAPAKPKKPPKEEKKLLSQRALDAIDKELAGLQECFARHQELSQQKRADDKARNPKPEKPKPTPTQQIEAKLMAVMNLRPDKHKDDLNVLASEREWLHEASAFLIQLWGYNKVKSMGKTIDEHYDKAEEKTRARLLIFGEGKYAYRFEVTNTEIPHLRLDPIIIMADTQKQAISRLSGKERITLPVKNVTVKKGEDGYRDALAEGYENLKHTAVEKVT
ncbi:MAG: hypothetical protein AAGB22_10780, partial [Bacteroidota bacterium]